jgi:hypothetical protein
MGVAVADLTAALWEMDPVDWRGDYFGWFGLLTAAQHLGVSQAEFVKWSTTDPVYAADARLIERIWNSAEPRHGGAFWKALSERGIKVGPAIERSSPLFLGLPLSAIRASFWRRRQPTRNWRSRLNTVTDVLFRRQDPDCLFWAACRVAEVMIDTKQPTTLKAATLLLEGNCPKLCTAIGEDEVHRIISNAFRQVEMEELEASETQTEKGN